MQFLLHAPPAVGAALIAQGHKVHELADADPYAAAREKQWDIITTDAKLAMAPFDGGKPFARSIVFLQLTADDTELAAAVERLFTRFKRLTPGRLYTVTANRVKVRQLPNKRRHFPLKTEN
jgi:hypothetical protein